MPWYLWTGDDRNAYGQVAGGSRNESAMERGESIVRAIPTVSILILMHRSTRFKVQLMCVQRKRTRMANAERQTFAQSQSVFGRKPQNGGREAHHGNSRSPE